MLIASVLCVLACGAVLVSAQQASPVKCHTTLLAHAALPSQTFAALPANIPADMRVSGKYDNALNRRNGILGSVNKGTSVKVPVEGQPVQGFSGIKTLRNYAGAPTGQFVVLTDNGYGNKFNSPDSALMFHFVTPDFTQKTVRVDRTVFLRDPNKVVPFLITNEHTAERYLTGADFDIESIQPVGGSFYFGDEFGPYLIETTTDGVVKGFWDTNVNNATALRSPENQLVRLPGAPTKDALSAVSFNVRRSKGFEGMAASRDGRFLYPMLEGALFDASTQDYENVGGKYFWRMLKFDTRTRKFDTTFQAKYPLESKTNSLGDFNIIDGNGRALVIERDDGEGDPRLGCAVTANATGCFKNPAAFKRVYLIDINRRDSNGFVLKLAYIDLLDIQDVNGVAAWGTIDGVFTFPFFTIENVDRFNNTAIVIGNDNNFPSSSTRMPGFNDNNEFAILDVGRFLTGLC